MKSKTKRRPEYGIWAGMIQRCTNKNRKYYPIYGGRGITVCDRWRYSFNNFLEDMGERPSPFHTIDRINNDGNYEPSNCRWSTAKEQSNNKSNSYKGMLCISCNERKAYTKKRCHRCSEFLRRNGYERPPVKIKQIFICSICKRNQEHRAKGLCGACYELLRRQELQHNKI